MVTMTESPEVDITPIHSLLVAAVAAQKELERWVKAGQEPYETLSDVDKEYLSECAPVRIMNLILIAVAAKAAVDEPSPQTAANLREAVGRTWKE